MEAGRAPPYSHDSASSRHFPHLPKRLATPGTAVSSAFQPPGHAAPPSTRSVLPLQCAPSALGRSLCSYGEQIFSQAGSPSPGGVPASRSPPKPATVFKANPQIKKKKKFQFQPSPVSPRPVPPSNSRSQSGLRSGSSRRAGVLQPRFFPWTQLQPWLFGNPGEFSRR